MKIKIQLPSVQRTINISQLLTNIAGKQDKVWKKCNGDDEIDDELFIACTDKAELTKHVKIIYESSSLLLNAKEKLKQKYFNRLCWYIL